MPLIDLANPVGSQALAQLAGPFGSYLGGSSFPSSYQFAKRFVNNANTAEGSGNNSVTALDDPTYLGFTLMFDISSPLFNGATRAAVNIPIPEFSPAPNANGNLNVSQVAGAVSDALSGTPSFPSEPSAIGYLDKIGETNRVEYLRAFVTGLLEVSKERPYYFQTIGGLLEAWAKSFEFGEDPFTGSDDADGITIGCLEAIDLKMTALFNLYKMAVYDVRYKRMIVPKNLLRFDIYIYVQEIRKFKTVRNWLGSLNPSDAGADTKRYVNENTSQVGFKFTECLWIPGACGKVFEGVTNVGGTIATTDIKFSYSTMENVSQYSGFDSKLDESKLQSNSDPAFLGKIKQFGKDQLDNAAAGAINLATRTTSSAIQGLTLGNVFGLRNSLLGTISNPQGLLNAAVGASIQGAGLPATNNSLSGATSLGDNVSGNPLPVNNTLTGSNAVFDEIARSANDLASINAFGAPGPAQDNGGLASSNIFE